MSENREMPAGWEAAKVAELIADDGLFSDGDWVESKDQDPNGSIRLLQLADVGDGRFIDKSSRFVNEEKFEKLRCTEVLERDVLIARMPDPLGRACLVPKLKQKSITVVDVAIIRPGRKSVDPAWLMHVINSPEIRQRMELESTGSTRKRIARGKISNIELPVPPLAEQKRIADKLEAVLGRVDACRARLDRFPALLKRFRQSVLAAATSGKLTEEWRKTNGVNHEWKNVRLKDTAHSRLGKMLDKSKNQGVLTSYLRNINVRWFGFNLADVQELRIPEEEAEELSIQDGDVLICEGGEPGRCAIWNGGKNNFVFQKALHRVRVKKGLLPQWLVYSIKAAADSGALADLFTGTTIKHLTGVALSRYEFPLPTIPEQQEIVRRVEALFAFADRIEARLATARKTVERLTPATLAKAFRGELVPQDPDDEPASVLLARIREIINVGTPAKAVRGSPVKRGPKANKPKALMSKSRFDEDVNGKPYLAGLLKTLGESPAEALFKVAQLSLVDFYKQLSWEVEQGLVLESDNSLKPAA